MNLDAACLGPSELSTHARFREKHSGAVLVQRGPARARLVRREASIEPSRIEDLVLDAVRARALEGAREQRTALGTNHDASGLHEQGGVRVALQLVPQLVGATHERHIERMLVVGLADDAGAAVRCEPSE